MTNQKKPTRNSLCEHFVRLSLPSPSRYDINFYLVYHLGLVILITFVKDLFYYKMLFVLLFARRELIFDIENLVRLG